MMSDIKMKFSQILLITSLSNLTRFIDLNALSREWGRPSHNILSSEKITLKLIFKVCI